MPPMTLRQMLEQAMRDQQAGRLAEAQAVYRKILVAKPNEPNTLHLLGMCEYQLGRLETARELISRAVALMPNSGIFRGNLGHVLAAMGREEQAVKELRRSFELQPDNPEVLNDLGRLLHIKGQVDEAIGLLRRAIAIAPNHGAAHINLGSALRAKGEKESAIDILRKAIELIPTSVEGWNNLGNALAETGQFEQAIAIFHQAIDLRPDLADTHSNLGTALRAYGKFPQAIDEYRQAIAIQKDFAMAHFSLGLTLLLVGDFEEGCDENEWRWKVKEHGPGPAQYSHPVWDGSDLRDRTILLYAEQGFGDIIHFSRYVRLVAERGAKVILAVHRPLVRLMRSLGLVEKIVSEGDPVPKADVRCSLMSLMRVFGTTLQTIPARIPYLTADAELSSRWRKRIGEDGRLKVGLAWAGRPAFRMDHWRSMQLSQFSLFGQVAGVRFFSLQKGEAAKQSAPGLELTDWTNELEDFADTAALIDNLDLVITVDTAIAHLAGAMGKQVWTLLPIVPDWRWLLDRSDSPWYPTMRLFRQSRFADWNSPMDEILHALRSRASSA